MPATQLTQPSTNTAPQTDAFDTVSSGQYVPGQNFQVQQQTQQPAQGGDVFDQLTSGTTSVPGASGTSGSSTKSAVPDALHIDSSDNPALKFAKGANAVGAGIGTGILSTLNGGAELLHLPHSTLQQRQQQLEQQNSENPTLNKIGYGGETLMEFLTGDEALKALPISQRLATAAKSAEAVENSPRLLKALQIGANAMRTGVVQGVLGTVRSGGNVKTGAEEGGGMAALTAGLGAAGPAITALRAPFSLKAVQDALETSHGDIQQALSTATQAIQDDWHSTVRDIFDQAAKDAGVTPASCSASSGKTWTSNGAQFASFAVWLTRSKASRRQRPRANRCRCPTTLRHVF